MAGHNLIAAYRNDLLARLPADVAEEVVDGLAEACEHYRRSGLNPDAAATAALAEFGHADLVLDAFLRASPVRRLARFLVVTGPVVGGWWAAGLIASRAWDWPVPLAMKLVAGPLVVASVALLMTALLTRRHRALRRAGMVGGLGLGVLDAHVITAVLVFAPAGSWLFRVAACLSAARLTFIAGQLTRIIARPGV